MHTENKAFSPKNVIKLDLIDSAVDHVTVLLLMWRPCQRDATALSILQ